MQENVGDDLGKQWDALVKRAAKALKQVPLVAANTAKNFFQGLFNRQAWIDNSTQPWKRRKPGSKRDKGRVILTDSGKGKRAIRVIEADWGKVEVGINDPAIQKYMGAHNNGFRGTVQVRGGDRIASRKVGTKEMQLKGKQRRVRLGGRKQKIRGKAHYVNAHSRKMNLPKRKFIGNSAYLDRDIQREIILLLKTI